MDAKVIFHIDEFAKWNLLLNNVQNLLGSYEGAPFGVSIEVLANSEAVKGYANSGGLMDTSKLEALSQKGVGFVACKNALLGMKLSAEQIFPFVKVVPVGVRELIDRQNEGYAYIKP
ncbi:DsrE family protein [Oscillospiraceae bacterium MB08-C2-2]|nr:DsrE family protein [Oscillospiraceae bacterium MB08-C2-2]